MSSLTEQIVENWWGISREDMDFIVHNSYLTRLCTP